MGVTAYATLTELILKLSLVERDGETEDGHGVGLSGRTLACSTRPGSAQFDPGRSCNSAPARFERIDTSPKEKIKEKERKEGKL